MSGPTPKPSPRKTVTVVAAVLWRDGRVLLTRRLKDAHLGGLWEFPGGKVEPSEDPELALVRECREECGIDVRVDDILDVAFHAYPEKDVLLLFYECALVAGEVQNLGVASHTWCAPLEIDRYPLPPPDARVVAKIRALRGPRGMIGEPPAPALTAPDREAK